MQRSNDDDRYDLDESNMFQTSFNDSYFMQSKVSVGPGIGGDKELREPMLLGQSTNESEETFI